MTDDQKVPIGRPTGDELAKLREWYEALPADAFDKFGSYGVSARAEIKHTLYGPDLDRQRPGQVDEVPPWA